MPTSQILLVRHGQTEFNTRGIYQGQIDSPLTQQGIDQAQALAPRVHAMHSCPTLYSSDLGRAQHTAQLIADPQHHVLAEEPGLRERDYGIFQGLIKTEIHKLHPAEWTRHRSGDPNYVVPGGESQQQLLERVVATIGTIAESHPGELVIAVTHGGALATFAKHVLGLPVNAPRRFDMGNTSISLFTHNDSGHWIVRFFGDLAHLPDLPAPNQTEG